MNAREKAAVEAAVVAARAVEARSGEYGGRSPAEILSRRLDGLDWSGFDSRGYELLREVLRRVNGRTEPAGGSLDDVQERGAKYESRYSPARARLSRARA